VTKEQLRELQTQRLAAVSTGLREGKSIEERRVVGAEATGDLEDATPAVQVKLRPVSKLGTAEAPVVPQDTSVSTSPTP